MSNFITTSATSGSVGVAGMLHEVMVKCNGRGSVYECRYVPCIEDICGDYRTLRGWESRPAW